MTTLQVTLLAFATSLDSLALMSVQGAMLSEIRKKELIKISLFSGSWQTLGFLLGNLIIPFSEAFEMNSSQLSSNILFKVLAFFIFCGLSLRMIRKGLNNEYIHEQRQHNINFKQLFKITIISSVTSFVAGLGLAFTKTQLGMEFIIIYLINILSVFIGVYLGYWFGYEQKTEVYKMSSVIFLVSATSVLF